MRDPGVVKTIVYKNEETRKRAEAPTVVDLEGDKITCVITAHLDDPSYMIENMRAQTYKKTQLLAVCSGIDIASLKEKYQDVEFFDVPNRVDWGQSKRAIGLTFAEGEFICFANCDDEYFLHYLEEMVSALKKEEADFAYCSWIERGNEDLPVAAYPGFLGITSGSFMVRTGLAKRVGWHSRAYEGDWHFVRDVLALGAKTVYVPKPLMFHN